MSNSAASKSEKNSSRGFLDLMQSAMGKEQAAPDSTEASGPSLKEEPQAGDVSGSGLAQGRLRAEFALLAGQRVGRCSREGGVPTKESTSPKKPRVAKGHADKANADKTTTESSSPAESKDGGASVAPATPPVTIVTPQDGLDAGATLVIAADAAGVGAAGAAEATHGPKESSEASETEHGQAAPHPAPLIHRSRLPIEMTVESRELPAEDSPSLGAKAAASSTTEEASLTTPAWMRVLPGAHSQSSSSPALSGRGESSSSIANATANEAVPAVARAISSSHTAATAPGVTANGTELGESAVQIKTAADTNAKQDIAFAARLTPSEGATASESSTPAQRTPATSHSSTELEPAESQASTAKDGDALHAGADPSNAGPALLHAKATQPVAEGGAAWGTANTDVRGASSTAFSKSSSTEHTTSVTPPAEPPPVAAPASRTVRELNLKLTGDQAQSADVRMVERNGEVRVMVRASDSALASSLQGNLTDLLSHLSGRGITTELWRPAADAASSGADDQSSNGAGTQSDAQGGNASHQDSGGHARGQREPAPEWFEETFENVKSRFGRRSPQ